MAGAARSAAAEEEGHVSSKGGQLQLHAFTVPMWPRQYFHYHDHSYHEFFYCLRGSGTQYRERRELSMRHGDLFLFPAGVVHMAGGDPGTDCQGVVVYVHERAFADVSEGDAEAGAMLAALCRYGRERDARLPLTAETGAAIDGMMRGMADEAQQRRPGYRCALKATMQRFLIAISRDPCLAAEIQPALQRVTPHEQIADVCQFLAVHFRDPVTVAEMADLAGMSRSHFHAMFKRETGMPLTHYLQALRVAEAERLLAETEHPVLDIALESGFPSLSHFYAVFGRRQGCSPSVYRERLARAHAR